MVTVEATGVVPEGRITFWDSGLWQDEHIVVRNSLLQTPLVVQHVE